jgi:hypothetical protein
MRAVGLLENLIFQTMQCKITEENFSYSNKTPRNLFYVNNLHPSLIIFIFYSNYYRVYIILILRVST